MGKDARAVIPPGKEDEYAEDRQGKPIHVKYGSDPSMSGTVIPSGIDLVNSGGSYGFSTDDMDIPQNIIAFEADGERTITTITRREFVASLAGDKAKPVTPHVVTPAAVEQLGDQAEAIFSRVGEAAQAQMLQLMRPETLEKVAAVARPQYNPFEGGLMPTKKAKKKKRAKSRRGVESQPAEPQEAEAPEEAQAAAVQPAVVKLSGPFGSVAAAFSGVFRDGMCLVLYSDARQLPSLYSLPENDEPTVLTVEYDEHVVECIWAGIQFTMPNSPVTFIVLLVEKEQADGQGQPSQAGLDDM